MSYSDSEPDKQLSIRFVLATGSHPMLCICLVVECKGRAKVLFDAIVSYVSMSSFNNSPSSFNPSHPHVHTSHHTHLTILAFSRQQGWLPLMPCLNGQSQKPTPNPGGEKKGLHSLIKGSIGHRNVHIRGLGYTYRTINFAKRLHLEPQDHHHRRCPA